MAHFAQLDDTNTVLQVIVVHNNELMIDGIESEDKGIIFCQSLYSANSVWKQTSYNGNIRKNYAGIGYVYDSDRDAFIPPKPFNSWVLNEDTCLWVAPVPRPEGEENYVWDELTTSWIAAAYTNA